jgi:hypothetical protein
MSLDEIVPALRTLPRADKLHLIQLLAADLAGEEAAELPSAGASCPIWSPFEAFDAAQALLRLLEECPLSARETAN